MNPRARTNGQTGFVMIEAMVSILIFSIGILALVSTLAMTTNKVSDAKYRTDASMLANQLIGQMWSGNRTQATLQANFSSPTGPLYTPWAATVQNTLPGVTGTLMPTVAVSAVTATSTPSSYVTITIQWQAPQDKSAHVYTSVAQIL